MMGAGNSSSTLYKCSPNSPSGGGNKKQGITSRVGLNNWENREIQTQSNGIGRFKLFFMNQLGGVEPGHSMFGGRWNRADGLTMNMYTQQLQKTIQQDETNGTFQPIEKRRTILKSRPPIFKSPSEPCYSSDITVEEYTCYKPLIYNGYFYDNNGIGIAEFYTDGCEITTIFPIKVFVNNNEISLENFYADNNINGYNGSSMYVWGEPNIVSLHVEALCYFDEFFVCDPNDTGKKMNFSWNK